MNLHNQEELKEEQRHLSLTPKDLARLKELAKIARSVAEDWHEPAKVDFNPANEVGEIEKALYDK